MFKPLPTYSSQHIANCCVKYVLLSDCLIKFPKLSATAPLTPKLKRIPDAVRWWEKHFVWVYSHSAPACVNGGVIAKRSTEADTWSLRGLCYQLHQSNVERIPTSIIIVLLFLTIVFILLHNRSRFPFTSTPVINKALERFEVDVLSVLVPLKLLWQIIFLFFKVRIKLN